MTLTPRHGLSAVDREQEVRTAITSFVAARTASMGWDIRIRRMTFSDIPKLPDGLIEYEIVAPQQWEGWGGINIAVLARQHDRVISNIPVRIDVEALADTVVTLRQVDNGTILTASDLAVQKREITQNSRFAVHSIKDLTGKKVRTTIRPNQPVRLDQVEKIPLIKSGQLVTIVIENETMKISVSGKARSSGAEGDTIRVQNLSSLREIPARVISASTVQVAF
ncbi:MAG: flagellar basal body P-ring formation chaperone FlgA [Desulfuromonadaceae bacterium]|nr:flagellar basal body P-ring formation chaperone FlgA [Desulfuromonadaceae bacterium]MDD5104064.1 flagellar basal body P-ring formation chaperone FlgA [Desulfuromonadaceae bacterium]